jgi:hypothetical protein
VIPETRCDLLLAQELSWLKWTINISQVKPLYAFRLRVSLGSNTTLGIMSVARILEKLLTVTFSWASLPLAYAVSSIDTLATLFEGPSLVERLVWYLTMPAHSAIKVTAARTNTCLRSVTDLQERFRINKQHIEFLELNWRLHKPLEM